jgi:hypothetical protein
VKRGADVARDGNRLSGEGSAALNRFARPPACDSSGKVLQESGSDKPHYNGLHRSYDMAHLEPSLPVLGIQE